MKFKKVISIMAVLALTIFIGASVSQAGMWVGPEFGTSWSTDLKTDKVLPGGAYYKFKSRTGFNTGVMFGYDFTNYGAGAANFPDWMKYFGVAVGVSYNPLYLTAQGNQSIVTNTFASSGVTKTQTLFLPVSNNVDGSNFMLTFLVTGKIPLMVDKEYPNGRLAPYVGVGPGVVFTNIDLTNIGGRNQSFTNVALVTEAGIRYMVTPQFSADLAYRFRYSQPNTEVTIPGIGNTNLYGGTTTHQALARIAYHF